MTNGRHDELKILVNCRELHNAIIKLCNHFPESKFTLNQHIQRTSISIGSNIAEGNDKSPKDFNRFLDIAIGSCNELIYQVGLFELKAEDYNQFIDKIDHIKAVCIKLKVRNRRFFDSSNSSGGRRHA